MKKIPNDPLLSIFKNSSKEGYIEEINSIPNIPNFFNFISSDQNPIEQKIGVLENLLIIFKKNRYICEYFSNCKNKSIYIYLFDLYLSKKSSKELKTAISNLLSELILYLETSKDVYEYLFQSLSKIYNIENTNQEKTPENLYNHLSLLNILLAYKEKIPKPRNFFALSGNGKFSLDLKEKKINIGYCMSFIINFKIGDSQNIEGMSNIINVKFSNNTSISFNLKSPSFLLIKEGKQNEKMIKVLPPNEFVILVINLIVEDNNLLVYFFVNGENNLSPIKYKNNLDLKKDTIESVDFFENFYGEVTSISMLIEKEKSANTLNSKEFLPTFKNFIRGFHKTKYLKKFIDIISEKYGTLTNKLFFDLKIVKNIVFIFTPFNYFHSSWENKNKEENKILNDYFNKYNLLIVDKDNSIRNHRYQNYQKKIYLVNDITNFLPIAEMFLIHPQLLTEQNLELYLQIVDNIINFRKRNVEHAKKTSFFKILSLFIEKYPNQIFTEKVLDAFINIGKDMFKNNFNELTKTYFKNILLNEKILSKYSKNLQIKFWNQLLLFCQSDSDQLEKFLKMNRICLILRFYDKNKYKEMCCKNHLDMFKKEFSQNCNVMEPSMNERLTDIWKIIDLIINSQKPNWVLSLFKLLTLDLSPCLTNFIITAIIKALIRHIKIIKKKESSEQSSIMKQFISLVVVDEENSWLDEFIQEMSNNKYETIIINTFIHSLPDVKSNMLKLIYQIYQSLMCLGKQNEFKIFFNMMKKYLLPQKMFYEKKEEKETMVINDNNMRQYLNDVIVLFTYWSLEEPLIEINDDISFGAKKAFDNNDIIKNSDILEIIFELIKQINYDMELIIKFLEILLDLIKNPINSDTLLYNYRIFLMLLDLVYQCYLLKTNNKENNNNIEKAYSLGKSLISHIYINVLTYKENNCISDNYPFNEISLIFLYGDSIIFKNDSSKIDNIKGSVFSFISEIFMEIITEFKLKINPKINSLNSPLDTKINFIKSYYHQNYLIFVYKLFQFSFEYELDSLIYANNLASTLPNSEVISYYNLYLTSMRIDDKKGKCISLYWKNYQFFEEIYSKISYMWTKEYLYKDFEKDKLKNSNKVKKYEDIVTNVILNKDKRNLFKKEIELLCYYFINENKYDIYIENKDKDNTKENIPEKNFANINLLKLVQISLTGILYVIIAKDNESDLLKWVKELKHFVIFLIIASANIIIKEKEDKESSEKKFSAYINLQEQCLFAIFSCLSFLNLLRSLSSIAKQKIDKLCVSIYTLCFSILKNTYSYRKKHKISKKFCLGYKYNVNDLSGCAIFVLFNDYIKDKTKEKEKGDHVLINLDKLNTLLDDNYSQNIIKLLNETNWDDSFYRRNNIISETLSQKYFPVNDYKAIVEQRIDTLKKIDEEISKDNWEYSDDEILKLLPLYEKELVHYSNNSLEKNLKKKNLYKIIKKTIFSWRGYWSDRSIFYQEKKNNNNNDNDSFADKKDVSKVKYKLINHYTRSFMKPLLIPILDIHYYLPDFSGYDPTTIFNTKEQFIVNMDIDKIVKLKEEQKKKDDEKVNLKENYLRQIYNKSNPALADKLLKISDSLDFGKEEEFSVFKEEKDSKNNAENKTETKNGDSTEKEEPKKDDNNKKNNNEEEEKENRKYYLCCLVKTSHHIKGVCFVDDNNINFKVFLNQKTGEAMAGVNIGFTDKDDDYDEEKKTCFGSYFMFHQKDKNLYRISINYNDIKLILLKRYYFKNSGLEIFTTTNKSYYFNFKYEEERDYFIQNITSKLTELKTIINDSKDSKDEQSNIIGYSNIPEKIKEKRKNTRKEIEKSGKKIRNVGISKIIKEWKNWKINNFSFLMWMNFFGNRSYNDISQYPVFPWILSNLDEPFKIEPNIIESSLSNKNINSMTSNAINPSEASVNESRSSIVMEDDGEKKKKKKKGEEEYNYRDMKLPMGMMELNEEGKKRKNEYIEHYNNVKFNRDEFEGMKPYYYGSNYSNPIYVCNYLMRLFPFTHISIELQGNKLDDPNRLFLSVNQSFHNSISLKADLRELIPEFFYLPEMFLNINDINLGKLENDSLVYNVITPCNNNAYSFTEIMKRTFENEKLSSILNNWIDLIFGNKAKGKEAENAKNVFLEESYQESIDLKTIDIDKKIIYLKRVEFGLIPSQVMSKECPKRDKKKEVQKEKELTEYNMNNVHKIKVVQIKHDSSNDKNMKNPDGQKSKLLKADIISNDRIMMLYDNNTIIEDKIGSSNEDIVNIYKINPCDNQINLNYLGRNINKVIKFCNSGMTIIVGGYYDGRFDVINIEEKAEKSRLDFHPFSEEEPILNISLNKEESFLVVGNSIGNVAVYKIDIENDNYELYKKIFNQMSPISDININDDLNLFATASIDGYVNLYTLPLCKRVRSIKVPIDNENHGKFNYVFLSESSLPSIIMITEKGETYEIFSYSINGQLLVNCQDKNMESPIKVKDLNSLEYLIYYANNNEINIRNLPSLCLQITIGNIFNSIRNLVINEDLSSLFAINEDGSQIQAIRD